MNASEFNTFIAKTIDVALTDGVEKRKMGIEQMVGILEIHKSTLMDIRKTMAMQAAIKQAPLIVQNGQLPLNGDRK